MWIDKVMSVRRITERLICLKILLGDLLVNCICAIAADNTVTNVVFSKNKFAHNVI